MKNKIIKWLAAAGTAYGMAAGFSFLPAAQAADLPRLRWIVKDGETVDRARAERLYLEACRVIENRFVTDAREVRPGLTIYVGQACPDAGLKNICLGPATGELFLPQWDAASPGAVTQATLIVGLMQLLDPKEVRSLTETLLQEDARDFVDVRALASRTND